MASRPLSACALLSLVAAATAADHATIARENDSLIRSVYWDQRLDAGPVRSGGLGIPGATVTAKLYQEYVVFAADSVLVNPPGIPLSPNAKPLTEDRLVGELTLRQGFDAWMGWRGFVELRETGAWRSARLQAGVDATFDDNGLAGDPRAQIFVPIYQDRYWGITAGAGVTLPFGSEEEWSQAHGELGYVGGVRATSIVPGISFLSAQIHAEGTLVQDAVQTLYTAPTTDTVHLEYRGLDIGASLLWAASEQWSLGATLGYKVHQFSDLEIPGIADATDETVRSMPYGLVARIQWPRHLWWSATVGADYLNTDADTGTRAGVALEIAPW